MTEYPLLTTQRHAIIIGGAHDGSIGDAINKALLGSFARDVPPHSALDVVDRMACGEFFAARPDADTLILSQGRTSMAPFEQQSVTDIIEVMNVNVLGTINAAQAFVNATKGSPWRKQIVIISSLGASRVFTNSSIYCASKAAISHLAKCMAWELTPEYDVFAVEPGNVSDTPLSRHVMEGMPDPARFNKHNKRESIVTVQEVAAVVKNLLTTAGSWQSGEPIRLSGGDRG